MSPHDHPVLNVERQFLGCLMHLPAPVAGTLLNGLDADAFTDPHARLAAELAVGLTAVGRRACPLALFEAARNHIDPAPGTVGTERLARFAMWSVDTYGTPVVLDADHATWLKGLLCEAAWRRAISAHAVKTQQAAEQCATAELRRIQTSTTHLEALWARYLSVTGFDDSESPASRAISDAA